MIISGALSCAGMLIANSQAAESVPAVIPNPVSMEVREGVFRLNKNTRIVYEHGAHGAESVAEYVASVLRPSTGYAFSVVAGPGDETAVDNAVLLSTRTADKKLGNEGYELEVTAKKIVISAPQPAGLFYGVQTLRQMLPVEIFNDAEVKNVDWTVPCSKVTDYPRFRWRGMHLDVARHFFPKEFVKKYIDLIALHKMNSFHWHLTEDQGWRIEIKRYPKLTEIGAWRKETLVGHLDDPPHTFDGKVHGGFYAQDEIRDIVEYARQRHVNIVPEIEMPGHSQAAIAAYPELGNTGRQLPVCTIWGVNENVYNVNEPTIEFLQNVLTEVLDLFPGKFIHVGGDEVPKVQWQESPQAQARIKELGLKDEHELQSYFIGRMDKFLTSKGRRLIGWDEILEGGLAEGATVMSWRGVDGGVTAARAGHDVVMAPYESTYFDYYQADPENEPLAIGGMLPLKNVYAYEPIPEELTGDEAAHVLGAQGQVWTEYISTPEKAEYMAFPRACALSEVVWTPQSRKDFDDFRARLTTHVKRLDALGVNYRALDPEQD